MSEPPRTFTFERPVPAIIRHRWSSYREDGYPDLKPISIRHYSHEHVRVIAFEWRDEYSYNRSEEPFRALVTTDGGGVPRWEE